MFHSSVAKDLEGLADLFHGMGESGGELLDFVEGAFQLGLGVLVEAIEQSDYSVAEFSLVEREGVTLESSAGVLVLLVFHTAADATIVV